MAVRNQSQGSTTLPLSQPWHGMSTARNLRGSAGWKTMYSGMDALAEGQYIEARRLPSHLMR